MALRATYRLAQQASGTDSSAAARMFVSRVGMEVTATGGTGKESSNLSGTGVEARSRVTGLYRNLIRHIPQMRKDFSILEDEGVVNTVIRDLFRKHATVRDTKIIDMLVWKGNQELEEIQAQWKGRHHLMSYMEEFHAQEGRAKAIEMARKLQSASGAMVLDEMRLAKLSEWKERNLIPPHIDSWAQYLTWKGIEDEKFNQFATQNGIFTEEDLIENQRYAAKIGYATA